MTLAEWKESVKNEYDSLIKYYAYLNGDGRNTLAAYLALYSLTIFHDTAKDIYDAIQLENYFKLNNSAILAIRSLGEIVAKEGKYVDYSST